MYYVYTAISAIAIRNYVVPRILFSTNSTSSGTILHSIRIYGMWINDDDQFKI
jgi:hypothetical protein